MVLFETYKQNIIMKIAEAYSAEQSGIKGAIAKADESSAGAAAPFCVALEKEHGIQKNFYVIMGISK